MAARREPRVLVAGAGAVGSVIGGLLARGGSRVTLFGRESHLRVVEQSGLAIEGIWGQHTVRELGVATRAGLLESRYDLILLTVKSYDTDSMLDLVAPLLDSAGALISLQNGLGNTERVAAAVGSSRALGGRVIFGAEMPRPGVVRVTVCADKVLIGAAVASDREACGRARLWADGFAASAIPCQYTADLRAALWGKLLYNVPLNALAALFRVPYGDLGDQEEARKIMDGLVREAFAVAVASGVQLPWRGVEEYRRLFYDRLLPATRGHRSSMLQDLERGRRTEVDTINGSVWQHGARVGIPTPLNAALTRLIHLAEQIQSRPAAD